MTARPGRADPTDAAYHGLVVCDECNGEESMPDCKCNGEGWLLNGQPATKEAIKDAFAAMHAARKARRCAEIPARFAVIEEVSARVAMSLGKDDSRVTELLAMVKDLLPAPASGWQDEKPGRGFWQVSIRPEIRKGFPAVVDCEVWEGSIEGVKQWVVQYKPAGDLLPLNQDWFTGAKWKRRETPQDPFLSEVNNGK